MENVKTKDEQGFTDLYFIAMLLAYSPLSYSRVDKSEQRQKFFFNDDILEVYIMAPEGPKKMREPKLDELKVWYTANILMYPPRYPECIKKVKTEVHS